MSTPQVYFDKGASPYARVFCSTIRLAVQKSVGLATAGKLTGCVSLKSIKGPQSITLHFGDNSIRVADGISPDALLTIEMDFDNADVKPRVRGLFRHPLVAYRISKLLMLPLPNWADSAKRFWAATSHLPNMPAQLTVTCTDESRSLSFGEGPDNFEILGTSSHLGSLLAGQSILVQETMNGRLRIRGSLEHLAGLSQAGQQLMLGETGDINAG